MYPENPEGTQVIVNSMNMGYISDTARNLTHNLFRPKRQAGADPTRPVMDFHFLIQYNTLFKRLVHTISDGKHVISSRESFGECSGVFNPAV